MSIEEKMRQMLVENGLFEQDCDAVMEIVKGFEYAKSMQNRWNDATDGYTDKALVAVWRLVKQAALEWIDANCPMAFNRSMFETKAVTRGAGSHSAQRWRC